MKSWGIFLLVALALGRWSPLPSGIADGTPQLFTKHWIDINTASSLDLQLLPGMGPVLARILIGHRPYNAPEDLLAVPGIGPVHLKQWRELIVVGDDQDPANANR